MSPLERGSLVIADIGGYTRYLTGVELSHSTDILADLINVVVEELAASLVLAKLEGDAVFAFDRSGDAPVPGLLGTIESTYFAFRRKVRTIYQNTTCRCAACSRIPDLDLKFVAHHGEFALHQMAGLQELVGAEVILVHRLLKNHVQEDLGLDGYALLTEPCVAAARIDPAAAGFVSHPEHYDDVGDVTAVVLDLHARWDEEEARTAIRLGPGEADFEYAGVINAPPGVVWDYLTDPAKRILWQAGTLSVDQQNPGGAMGVGTLNHCNHGEYAVDEEIVDWKPHAYFTMRSTSPMVQMLMTTELERADEGRTRFAWRASAPDPDERPKLEQAAPMFRAFLELGMQTLAGLLAESHATNAD